MVVIRMERRKQKMEDGGIGLLREKEAGIY